MLTIALLPLLQPSADGADDDVITADKVVWQEVFGHPAGHNEKDEGWEHVGAAGTVRDHFADIYLSVAHYWYRPSCGHYTGA